MGAGDLVVGSGRSSEPEVENVASVKSNGSPGWLRYAGVLLVFAGAMRILDAFWAFGFGGRVPQNLRDALLGEDLSTYGWWWLLTGLILIGAGSVIAAGMPGGRWFGVAAASICGLGAATWLPYYPIWSLAYVLLTLVVIGILVVGSAEE